MKMKQLILAGCSILVLSTGVSLAGPCDTGRAANLKDAGVAGLAEPERVGRRQAQRSQEVDGLFIEPGFVEPAGPAGAKAAE